MASSTQFPAAWPLAFRVQKRSSSGVGTCW